MRRISVALIFALGLASALAFAGATVAADRVSAASDARCRGYGLTPGSDGYVKCVADLKRDQRSRNSSASNDLSQDMKARADANAAELQAQMAEQAAQSRANLDALDAQIAAQQAAAQQAQSQAMQNTIPH
ncbi:MAG TPA: hypothetical protein VG407_17340 [Caulobacteraceae bacterium]|jgi:hypothetical protein|nr:hypothetical protein [Caulobacteraceae bacterium]